VTTVTGQPFEEWQVNSEFYYTGARCLRCSKLLNADGGHPAEIYAGTYNGLCYGCTGSARYIVRVSLLDGARQVSWPPHCPSWRRDRESHTAYEGCETCGGLGIELPAYRGWENAGQYCRPCLERFSSHPVRVIAYGWRTKVMQSADRAFQRRMTLAAGLKLTASRRKQEAAWDALDDEVRTALRDEVKGRYLSLLARHEDRIERLGMNAWREPTEEELAA
jgi:hypothetical protein